MFSSSVRWAALRCEVQLWRRRNIMILRRRSGGSEAAGEGGVFTEETTASDGMLTSSLRHTDYWTWNNNLL